MIEHPVPQNITAYQFHLIGNMTVKQFLILLAGVGVGFLFYTSNLPGVIKWFFIIFFGLLAAATAFVPYESRTLDQWLVNFIRAIYRPTKYYWTRQPQPPNLFSYKQRSDTQNQQQHLDLAPYKRQQVQQYLTSLNAIAPSPQDPLDLFAQSTSTQQLFETVEAAEDVEPSTSDRIMKPSLQVRTRPLRPRAVVFTSPDSSSSSSVSTFHPPHHTTATKSQKPPRPSPVESPSPVAVKPTPSTSATQVAPTPVLQLVQTESAPQAAGSTPDTTTTPASESQEYLKADSLASSSQSGSNVQPAKFNRSLPFPSLPDKPNLLVGMVHDPDQRIVANAIVEILDEKGNTVRAMKTNALGQFYISSPLPAGTYFIETEKDGLKFPVYTFSASNTVLEPVDIQANTPTA